MSVSLQPSGIGTGATPYYTGLSTDARPQPVSEKATFFELDTGNEYVLCDGQWYLFRRLGTNSPSGTDQSALEPQLQAAILGELRRIRRGVEMALQTEIPDPGE